MGTPEVNRRREPRFLFHKPSIVPTTRELASLHATVRYGSAKAAAFATGVSQQTVKNHLASLYRKLDVGGFGEALYLLYLRALWDEGPTFELNIPELWVNGIRYVPESKGA